MVDDSIRTAVLRKSAWSIPIGALRYNEAELRAASSCRAARNRRVISASVPTFAPIPIAITTSARDDVVVKYPDAFDLHLDTVTDREITDAGGCAGRDHVPDLECHVARAERDQRAHVED